MDHYDHPQDHYDHLYLGDYASMSLRKDDEANLRELFEGWEEEEFEQVWTVFNCTLARRRTVDGFWVLGFLGF